MRPGQRLLGILVSAALVAGCEAAKSSNPLSPSVAGPLPGVTITAPRPLEPSAGAELSAERQPLTLLFENASSTGPRPLTYSLDVALDAEFTNRVFSRENLPPGDGGRTSFRLPEPLASGWSYYWRARAQDGANTGPYSGSAHFSLYTPVVIDAPVPITPVGGVRTDSRRPKFSARNAARSGPAGTLSYMFQIATHDSFTGVVAVVTLGEQPNETQFTIAQELDYDRVYFWRVKAYDTAGWESGWSSTQGFYTPVAPPPPPPSPPSPPPPSPAPAPPPPGPTPPPPPPSGGWPRTGEEVVAWANRTYPQYLRPVGSVGERQDNMRFLRDRMIEAGICGGMDLGWNLKRGGPEISIDFITHVVNGRVLGVDIAYDYDNNRTPLVLTWAEGEFPFYARYEPRPSCR